MLPDRSTHAVGTYAVRVSSDPDGIGNTEVVLNPRHLQFFRISKQLLIKLASTWTAGG